MRFFLDRKGFVFKQAIFFPTSHSWGREELHIQGAFLFLFFPTTPKILISWIDSPGHPEYAQSIKKFRIPEKNYGTLKFSKIVSSVSLRINFITE